MTEAEKLLQEAHEILKDRWFIIGEEDEFNDNEVIDLDKKIVNYLERRGIVQGKK